MVSPDGHDILYEIPSDSTPPAAVAVVVRTGAFFAQILRRSRRGAIDCDGTLKPWTLAAAYSWGTAG